MKLAHGVVTTRLRTGFLTLAAATLAALSLSVASSSAGSSVETPPEPDDAAADETANADDPASIASAAINGSTTLGLDFAAACETLTSRSFVAYGVS